VPELVSSAIAKEEALERIAQVAKRRVLAKEDARKTQEKIDLRLGEQFKKGFKVGLSASQMSRESGISVPRVYQLRNEYQRHIDEEHGL